VTTGSAWAAGSTRSQIAAGDTDRSTIDAGIGGALVAEAAERAFALGAERVFIVADDERDATRLYERLGFRTVWVMHDFALELSVTFVHDRGPRRAYGARMSRIYPVLRYRDAPAAIDWLEQAFGFERHEVHTSEDGSIVHAELFYGDDDVLGLSSENAESPFGPHAGKGWVYVVVDDPDSHHARAKAAGAEIVMELADQDYGSRDYSARDPEGNLWSFGTYQFKSRADSAVAAEQR
jgi:uncharacterized glyoxalase superfamily protein PhnB